MVRARRIGLATRATRRRMRASIKMAAYEIDSCDRRPGAGRSGPGAGARAAFVSSGRPTVRRDGVRAVDRRDAGMCRRRRRRRQGRPRARVWHGGSRARRAERAGHDLRGRLGVEAVHRGGRPAARARRQAVDRRSGPQVHPGAARLRRAADDPSHADAHQRPARLGRGGRHRRLAAHHARPHPRARARHRVAPEGAELHARDRLVLQQHRLQPGGHHRGARERAALRGRSRASGSSCRSA